MAVLRVEGLEAGYGDTPVLRGINLQVEQAEIVALVGSNGAGKTTLLKTVLGLVPTTAGSIHFDGQLISTTRTYQRIRSGISLVPEGRRLFAGLSVEDNLMLGAYQRRDKEAIGRDLQHVYALFPILKDRRKQLAGALSGGEQQMCAIGRGLMAAPRLLLIDELSLGLSPVAVDLLLETVKSIREQGHTVVVVEQDVQTALGLADRAYVIETGQVVLHGPSDQLLADTGIRKAYLGI
jgi:branched-chain amino acid transport system ATP-binding protein